MDINKTWTINEKEPVFECKIFEIDKLHCYLPSKDKHNDFYSLRMKNWVNVFALTKDDKVIMVKQHRIGRNIVTTEVPAGTLDSFTEDPDEAALRELTEETGYTTDNIILLKKISVNPAIQDNFCFFYLALDCVKTKDTDFDETEEIELVLMDKKEIFESTFTDLIDNSLSLQAVMLAKEYLERKK